MVEKNRLTKSDATEANEAETSGVDIGRREALKNIGALAGAAPAVAVLLSPSASRAAGCGSPGELCGDHIAPTWDLGSGAPGGTNTGLLGNGRQN